MKLYADEGINSEFIWEIPNIATGAAGIMVNEKSGDNSIIVVPGVADALVPDDLDEAESGIAECAFLWLRLKYPSQ